LMYVIRKFKSKFATKKSSIYHKQNTFNTYWEWK